MEHAMNREFRVLGLAAAALLLPAVAFAQAPPSSQAPAAPNTEQRDSKACAPGQGTVGKGGDVEEKNPPAGSLSDRLARSDGVICPPSQVDPDIRAPTPRGGTMKVIPPPGSPGGDPSIQPK
jgi:hypothetical protein